MYGYTASTNPYDQFAVKNSLLIQGLVPMDRSSEGSPNRRSKRRSSDHKAKVDWPEFGQVAGQPALVQQAQPSAEAEPLEEPPPENLVRKVESACPRKAPEASQVRRHFSEGGDRRSRHAPSLLQAGLDVPAKHKQKGGDSQAIQTVDSDLSQARTGGGAASVCSTQLPASSESPLKLNMNLVSKVPIQNYSNYRDDEGCQSPKSPASTICDHGGFVSDTPRNVPDRAGYAWEGIDRHHLDATWKPPTPQERSDMLLQPSTTVLIRDTGTGLDGVKGVITLVDSVDSLYRVRLPDGTQRKIAAEKCHQVGR